MAPGTLGLVKLSYFEKYYEKVCIFWTKKLIFFSAEFFPKDVLFPSPLTLSYHKNIFSNFLNSLNVFVFGLNEHIE
jgi:hypothetical protein